METTLMIILLVLGLSIIAVCLGLLIVFFIIPLFREPKQFRTEKEKIEDKRKRLIINQIKLLNK